jgi:tripartite-type tricarboxylate transporter receptor subunit TctC
VKRQIEHDAIETKAMSPSELTEFMQSEIERWTPMIKAMLAAKERATPQ